MTKEKLMEWGLTETQAGKVMEGLNGSFVTKARFNEVNAELTAARKTVSQRDAQLEALKQSAGDTEALRKQLTELQSENRQKDADHAAELKALKLANAVGLALTNARAKNNIAAQALLSGFLATAEISDDGTVKGLDDEIKKLMENAGTAFLFEQAPEKRFRGARAAEKGGPAPDAGDMSLEKLRALSPAERHEFFVNHPDEYKQLYGGNA